MGNNTTFQNDSHQMLTPRPRIDFDHFSGTVNFYKAIFGIINGLGIAGNLLVIVTIVFNRNMRSSIHYLLGNLAFSDLLFAILAPFHITMLVKNYNWDFGAIFCKVCYFIFRSLYTISVTNLTLITVERFLATQKPLSFRANSRRTFTYILISWVFSFIISSPYLFVMKYTTSRDNSQCICFQDWQSKSKARSYYMFIYICLYFVPFFLMIFMHARIFATLRNQPMIGDINGTQQRQRRTRKRMSLIVVLIVVSFFICWSPWNIIEFIDQTRTNSWNNPPILPTVKLYATLAYILSTVINPVLLNFMSSEFRGGLRFIFSYCSCRCSVRVDDVNRSENINVDMIAMRRCSGANKKDNLTSA